MFPVSVPTLAWRTVSYGLPGCPGLPRLFTGGNDVRLPVEIITKTLRENLAELRRGEKSFLSHFLHCSQENARLKKFLKEGEVEKAEFETVKYCK